LGGVGVGVSTCITSAPTEQPKLKARPTNPKTAQSKKAAGWRGAEFFWFGNFITIVKWEDSTFS
jgi:hypothetical protein